MSEKECQKDNLKALINGSGQLKGELKDQFKIIIGGDSSGLDASDKFFQALSEAIAEKVAEGVTTYLNKLTPRLTLQNPQTGQWEQPNFEAIAPQLFSDEA